VFFFAKPEPLSENIYILNGHYYLTTSRGTRTWRVRSIQSNTWKGKVSGYNGITKSSRISSFVLSKIKFRSEFSTNEIGLAFYVAIHLFSTQKLLGPVMQRSTSTHHLDPEVMKDHSELWRLTIHAFLQMGVDLVPDKPLHLKDC